MQKIIKVEHMNKYFNSFKAIDDLSFELEGGKIYGIYQSDKREYRQRAHMLCYFQ